MESEEEGTEEWGTPKDQQATGKRGRPIKAESWRRERSASDCSLVEYFRKRKTIEGEEAGENRAFKKSSLIRRSPGKMNGDQKEKEEKEGGGEEERNTGKEKCDSEKEMVGWMKMIME